MKLFDSHSHYYDKRFEYECDNVYELIDSLFKTNVGKIINVATDLENAELAINMARRFDGMYTALGIHPGDIKPNDDMDEVLSSLEKLLLDKSNKAVALGEIGLDYHYEPYDKALQMRYFSAQLDLSTELNLPVCIHDREAHSDIFSAVISHKNARGVIHSYSGSPEMALEYAKRGWYISFSGTLTFKNAVKTVEAARVLPRELVLIETDAPYLAPTPHRGRLNHSGLMEHTAERLAEIWNVGKSEAIEITYNNAMKLYNII